MSQSVDGSPCERARTWDSIHKVSPIIAFGEGFLANSTLLLTVKLLPSRWDMMRVQM